MPLWDFPTEESPPQPLTPQPIPAMPGQPSLAPSQGPERPGFFERLMLAHAARTPGGRAMLLRRQQQQEAEDIGKIQTALQGALDRGGANPTQMPTLFRENVSGLGVRTRTGQQLAFQAFTALAKKAQEHGLKSAEETQMGEAWGRVIGGISDGRRLGKQSLTQTALSDPYLRRHPELVSKIAGQLQDDRLYSVTNEGVVEVDTTDPRGPRPTGRVLKIINNVPQFVDMATQSASIVEGGALPIPKAGDPNLRFYTSQGVAELPGTGRPADHPLMGTDSGKAAWPFIAKHYGLKDPSELSTDQSVMFASLAEQLRLQPRMSEEHAMALIARYGPQADTRYVAPGERLLTGQPPEAGINQGAAQQVRADVQGAREQVAEATTRGSIKGKMDEPMREKASEFFNVKTGRPISSGTTWGQSAAMHDRGEITHIDDPKSRQFVRTAKTDMNYFRRLRDIIVRRDDLFPDVEGDQIGPALQKTLISKFKAAMTKDIDPEVSWLMRTGLIRAIGINRAAGEVGVLTDRDRQAGLEALGTTPKSKAAALALVDGLIGDAHRWVDSLGLDSEAYFGSAPAPQAPAATPAKSAKKKKRDLGGLTLE